MKTVYWFTSFLLCRPLSLSLSPPVYTVFLLFVILVPLCFLVFFYILFRAPKCCDDADRDSVAAGLLTNCPAFPFFSAFLRPKGEISGVRGAPEDDCESCYQLCSWCVWLATHRAEELFVGCTLLSFLSVCLRIRSFVCFLGLYSVGLVPKHKHTHSCFCAAEILWLIPEGGEEVEVLQNLEKIQKLKSSWRTNEKTEWRLLKSDFCKLT